MEVETFNRCKVYTPSPIANFMVDKLDIDFSREFKVLEPAVGEGNIFLEIIDRFLKYAIDSKMSSDKLKYTLENSFIAFDLDIEALSKLNNNLDYLLEKYYSGLRVSWQLDCFDLLNKSSVLEYNNITHAICNPPYIAYRDLDKQWRQAIKEYESCMSGAPNLYYAFYEYLVKNIKPLNKTVMITPTSYINNKNAYKLRKTILDYTTSADIFKFNSLVFSEQVLVSISVLNDNKSGFSFYNVNNSKLDYTKLHDVSIPKAENFEELTSAIDYDDYIKLEDIFDVSGAVATLDDNFYVIKPYEILKHTDRFIYFKKKSKKTNQYDNFMVEKTICKKVFKNNRSQNQDSDYIIFPYDINKFTPYSMDVIKEKFPNFYKYFKTGPKKSIDSIGYGRNQNLRRSLERKIVVPRLIKDFTCSKSYNEIITSGICLYIKEEFQEYEKFIIDILFENKSDLMNYLRPNCVSNSGNYFTMSTSVIKKTPLMRWSEFYERFEVYDRR